MLNLTIIGNIANQPELRFLPEGTAICNLRIIHNARILDRSTGDWRDGDTTVFDVACWRDLAEHVADGCKVGDEVIVTATSLTVDVSDDRRYVNLRTTAKSVGISARWYPAHSDRPAKNTVTDTIADTGWDVPTEVPVPAASTAIA